MAPVSISFVIDVRELPCDTEIVDRLLFNDYIECFVVLFMFYRFRHLLGVNRDGPRRAGKFTWQYYWPSRRKEAVRGAGYSEGVVVTLIMFADAQS